MGRLGAVGVVFRRLVFVSLVKYLGWWFVEVLVAFSGVFQVDFVCWWQPWPPKTWSEGLEFCGLIWGRRWWWKGYWLQWRLMAEVWSCCFVWSLKDFSDVREAVAMVVLGDHGWRFGMVSDGVFCDEKEGHFGGFFTGVLG